jgi:regulator of sigma E protease
MCGAISLQLAILNALPIPALDGGHMALLAFEKARRKDLTIELKEKILTGGFILLASLMALVVFLDLMKLRK